MALGKQTIPDQLKTEFLSRRAQNQGLDPDSKKSRSKNLFGRRLKNGDASNNNAPQSPFKPVGSVRKF